MEIEEKFIFEGKTSTDAIEKGLKQLNLSKEEVEIKILKDETKKSFFSILEPRIVKVEITKKTRNEEVKLKKEKEIISEEIIEKANKNISEFLDNFLKLFIEGEFSYNITSDNYYVFVNISGEKTCQLIGYRGETLNSLQTLISSIANKGINQKIRVILDISNYKEKRKKVLEELADKISKTVVKTGKKIVLEPMPAYERKIIHARLQNNKNITTNSVGEEPYRKIVVELKKY